MTDEETDAICRTWHSKTDTEKDAVLSELRRLRRIAHERPAFRVFGYESWRQNSEEIARDISENWEVGWVGAAPAIETAVLEKLLFSQRVEAWERVAHILETAVDDPAVNGDVAVWDLFRRFRYAVSEEADYSDNPVRRIVGCLVDRELRNEIISVSGRINGMKPHKNHIRDAMKVPILWEQHKAEGKSKNEAAPLIAMELGLAKATVRKKLQSFR